MIRIPNGSIVETVEDAGATDWNPPAREKVQWGVMGKVKEHHDSHGLCYVVEFDNGNLAVFETKELKVVHWNC